MICATCGSVGQPKTNTPGSLAIEIVLWFLFCLPGMIYSVWRLAARKKVCPFCHSPALVPEDSPRGRQLLAELRSSARHNPPPIP